MFLHLLKKRGHVVFLYPSKAGYKNIQPILLRIYFFFPNYCNTSMCRVKIIEAIIQAGFDWRQVGSP